MPAPISGGARSACLALTLAACAITRDDTGRATQRDVPSGWKIIQAADFNGDGLADALWTDPDTDHIAVWLLSGRHVLEAGPEILGPPGAKWVAVTAADMNLSGLASVPWARTDGRQLAVWTMRGTHLADPTPPVAGPAGPGWVAAMGGDVDGDGLGDILWYDERRHRIQMWLAQGNGLFTPGPELPGPPGTGWVVPTISDFNLDGMGDILWSNNVTGRIAVWLMHGAEVLRRGPETDCPPGHGWDVPTGADFNHDGMTDVLWNDPDQNLMAVWLMAGTDVLEFGPEIPGPAGPGWSIGSAGDTDGDGMADALWENVAERRMAVWTMSGTHVLAEGPSLPGPR